MRARLTVINLSSTTRHHRQMALFVSTALYPPLCMCSGLYSQCVAPGFEHAGLDWALECGRNHLSANLCHPLAHSRGLDI